MSELLERALKQKGKDALLAVFGFITTHMVCNGLGIEPVGWEEVVARNPDMGDAVRIFAHVLYRADEYVLRELAERILREEDLRTLTREQHQRLERAFQLVVNEEYVQ